MSIIEAEKSVVTPRDPFIDGDFVETREISVDVIREAGQIILSGKVNGYFADGELQSIWLQSTVYPLSRELFSYEGLSNGRGRVQLSLPTVDRFNVFKENYFGGPDFANVRLVLVDGGELDAEKYIGYLAEGEVPVSNQPYPYMHDVAIHALGALTLPAKQFDTLKLLCRDAMRVYAENPEKGREYAIAIGGSFDISTYMRPYDRDLGKWRWTNRLLEDVLGDLHNGVIGRHNPDLYYRARNIVAESGFRFESDNFYKLGDGEEFFAEHCALVEAILTARPRMTAISA